MEQGGSGWRQARAEDWAFVAARLSDPDSLGQLGPVPLSALTAAGPGGDQIFLIWEEAGRVAAYLWLTHATAASIKIEEFAVFPRGAGIGRRSLLALSGWILATDRRRGSICMSAPTMPPPSNFTEASALAGTRRSPRLGSTVKAGR